jgi:hypothetical protein
MNPFGTSPIGAEDHPGPPTRFAVLRHEGVEEPHYDLLFETRAGGSLMTWRSPAWPIVRNTTVQMLEPHRNLYLDYEGPLTDHRGHVRRITLGLCTLRQIEQDTYFIQFLDSDVDSILIWQTEGIDGVAFPASTAE